MKALLWKWRWPLLAVFLALIQFVPYGRDHENPPVFQEVQWVDARTRALAVRACFDCHSNETVYPWYAGVAPISWFIQDDIDTGRALINFSDFVAIQRASEASRVVREGSMPPPVYMLLHPAANLTDAERAELADGLDKSLGK